MFLSRSFLFVICFSFFLAFIYSETFQDDPKIDLESIRKLLDALEKKQESGAREGFSAFESDLNAALGSEEEGIKFYQSCVRKVNFEGMALDSKEWTDWKAKNQLMLGDKYFRKWIGLQLRYFQLWTRAYKKTEIVVLNDDLVALAFEIRNSDLLFEKEKSQSEKNQIPDFRKESIGMGFSASFFGKAYRLEGLFKETPGWDLAVGSSEKILESLLMERYRSTKNPKLFDLWEKRIEWEDLKAKTLSLSTEKKFDQENVVLKLQWSEAQDLKAFGLQNKAINLMIAIVSKAPDHPEFDAWIKQLRGMLGLSVSDSSSNSNSLSR